MKNTHIYIIGFPGTGKYTVAKEISALENDFKVVDNHLINNPLFSIIQQDGKTPLPPKIWDNIGKIWDVVLDTMVNISAADTSFIMTNFLRENNACPDDKIWFETVQKMAEEQRQSLFVPVHIYCSAEENKRRVIQPDRAKRMKCIDPDAVDNWHNNDTIIKIDHPHFLKLDITNLTPELAAKTILDHVKSLKH